MASEGEPRASAERNERRCAMRGRHAERRRSSRGASRDQVPMKSSAEVEARGGKPHDLALPDVSRQGLVELKEKLTDTEDRWLSRFDLSNDLVRQFASSYASHAELGVVADDMRSIEAEKRSSESVAFHH